MSNVRSEIAVIMVCSFVLGLVFGACFFSTGTSNSKIYCEKDLPRTQECTLQWVKPEVGK